MYAKDAIHILRATVERLQDDMCHGVITDAAITQAQKVLRDTKFINYEERKVAALLKGADG